MKRYTLLLVVLLALTACVSDGDAPPVASTPPPITATVVATTVVAPTANATAAPIASVTTLATVTPTLEPTLSRPDTPAPPLTPVPSATPGPSGFAPPASVSGFANGLVLIPDDGSVIVYTPATGEVETLFGPNTYRLGSEDGPDPVWMPPRLSPDGRRLLLPRIGDTWLAERAAPDATPAQATAGPLIGERRWATWSPDSRRIVYTATDLGMQDFGGGQVYVQDTAGGGEPELVATLPGDAFWAIWSPGCATTDARGDCGRSIAALDGGDYDAGLGVWLIDSETGATRQLGAFRPPAVDLLDWLRWTADGTGLIGRADDSDVFFPLDGGAPRPLVPEVGAATRYGHVAPDGSSYLRLEYPDPETTQLILGRLATGEEIAAPGQYERVVVEGWTSDSRFVVISAVVGGMAGLYAVDLAGWPVVGRPALLAADVYLLGLEWEMAQRATVVDLRPWATTEPPLPAGPVETWPRHEWAQAELDVAVPEGWRFEVDTYGDLTIANYGVTSAGLVALDDDLFRAEMSWTSYFFGDGGPEFSVQALRAMYYNKDVTEIEVGGVTGAVVTDPVTPVCATIMLPHSVAGRKGEITILYCPATGEWRAFVVEFLEQLGLAETVAPSEALRKVRRTGKDRCLNHLMTTLHGRACGRSPGTSSTAW